MTIRSMTKNLHSTTSACSVSVLKSTRTMVITLSVAIARLEALMQGSSVSDATSFSTSTSTGATDASSALRRPIGICQRQQVLKLASQRLSIATSVRKRPNGRPSSIGRNKESLGSSATNARLAF